jgi:hypothetical protein
LKGKAKSISAAQQCSLCDHGSSEATSHCDQAGSPIRAQLSMRSRFRARVRGQSWTAISPDRSSDGSRARDLEGYIALRTALRPSETRCDYFPQLVKRVSSPCKIALEIGHNTITGCTL